MSEQENSQALTGANSQTQQNQKKQNNQKKPKSQQGQDINQLEKVRREKLAALQAEGKDPFKITKYDVSVHTQTIKDQYDEYEGKEVSVAGDRKSVV